MPAPFRHLFICAFAVLGILAGTNLSAAETDADLTNLEISGATLAPTFVRNTTVYSASVPFTAAEVTLNGTPFATATAGIRTRLNGGPSQAGLPLVLPLRTGANRIDLRVNASGTPLADFPFSAGTTRNLALHPDGYVLQWGVAASNTPPALPTGAQSDVAGVFSGPIGEYLLKTDGSLLALSGSYTPPADLAAGVAGVTQPRVVAVDIGSNFAIALRADGTVRTWGFLTTPDATGVIAVAAGYGHALTLLANGRVTALGSSNIFGELNVPAAARSGVVAIAARNYRNLALKADGTLVQWGQVNSTQAAIPAAATDVVAIALNNNSNFALTRSGAVVAWGDPTSGIDQPPAGLADVVALKTGPLHQIALKADGSLVAWGRNDSSQPAVSPTGFAPLFTAPIRDYVVTVNRAIPSPALANLSISAGTLTPAFDPTILAYSATVPYGTTSLGLDATALAADTASLRLRLNGVVSQAGVPATLALRPGMNHLALRATAGGPALRDFAFAAGTNRNLAVSSAGAVMHYPVSVNGSSLSALPAGSDTNVTGVFSGNYGEYALKTDGTLLRLSGATVPEAAQPASPVGGPVRAPIASVAVGQSHVLVLRTDGTTFAWGTTASVNTIPADAQSGIIAIASGANHVQALRADGRVVAWGSNTYGESSPPGLKSGIVAIASYGQRNLALHADGRVITWGYTSSLPYSTPVAAQSDVVAIAAGQYANLALKADGTLVLWGDTSFIQQPPAAAQSDVVAIACGPNHQLALKSDGSLVVWGSANVGNTPITPAFPAPLIDAPVRDYHLRIERPIPPGLAWLGSSAGSLTPAFSPDTLSYTLPATPYTTLTLPDLARTSRDQIETRVDSAPFAPRMPGPTVAVSNGVILAVTPDGAVRAFGSGTNNTLQILPAATQSDVVAVAAGLQHAVVLKRDGSLFAWGSSNYPNLAVPADNNFVAITAGDYHTLALTSTGTVVAWGYGASHQLLVPAAAQSDVVAIAAGLNTSMALRRDGSVVAWGRGSTSPQTIPAAAQSDVVAIAAGDNHYLALRSDGSVVEWGGFSYPLGMAPIHGIVAIAAQGSQNLALHADGMLHSWGDSSAPSIASNTPPDLSTIVLGISHAAALRPDGSLFVFERAGLLNLSQYNGTPTFAGPFALPLGARQSLGLGQNTVELRFTRLDSTLPAVTYQIGIERLPTPAIRIGAGTDLATAHPYSHDFGLQRVGATSAPQLFTVRNTGTADLVVDGITLSGPTAADFAVTGLAFPLTLAPGTETTFTTTVNPGTTGFRFAVLILDANVPPDSTEYFRLRASGISLASELTTWRNARFTSAERSDPSLEATVWGDLADPDGDGLPNLLEYAVNSAPKTANPTAAAFALDDSVPGQPRLALTYVRVKNAVVARLDYRIEWTDTLAAAGSWTDLDVAEEVVSSTSTTETIRASVPATAPSRFLRLRVTAP